MALSFEQGPIRPPSEAASLLLRLTRNCPWNKCAFCRSYKGETFSRRSVEEIKNDIDTVVKLCRSVREISRKSGFGGLLNLDMLIKLYNSGDYQLFHVASWLHNGGKTVFLQDANSLVMKTADVVEILKYLKERLPSIERVTTYARSSTLARKSVEELTALKQAGLSRIHVGMESGSDEVLKLINKGATAQQHIEAGRRVKQSGISLSEYVILGMGGKQWAREHALETARVLNMINPDFIRLRSLTVAEGTPLSQKVQNGEFEEETEAEVLTGEKLFIEHLDGIQSNLVSDHSMNLLEEVQGKLPADKPAMLATIDRFLALPEREKQNFILGKRWGVYRVLDDMRDPSQYARVAAALDRLEKEGKYQATLSYLKNQVI
ncbi:radical SAM protein [Pelotomaculum terephthalicicum JT]|uniref:radical SAM protein n=1 Tax=Pelotomaculum TaxID=191373 RepID=UPI0009C940DE|nr:MULTISPECIES: radical SAM protein [Pelotomaculum]MCG9967114.1 radical SAM protein [Pelotomaculum terephthalicicum JT]OPX87788.1 MAG: coproporphyrinogen III oxidase [Pelotomaculum sp. PtaB.Bin117]OPY60474.1 MAG: coproporphyrinogen III oxidase [Pelotomaculum sp. PtaU1.Bin065]